MYGHTLNADSQRVVALTRERIFFSLSPDGTRVAAAFGMDGTVRLWEAATWQPRHVLQAHSGGATGVSFSPDGHRLATSGQDGLVRVWDREGKVVLTLKGHAGPVRSVAYSPDGSRLASGCAGTEPIRLWDAATGKHLRNLAGHGATLFCAAYSPDGRRIAVLRRADVLLYDARLRSPRRLFAGAGRLEGLAWSPDGRWLLVGWSSADQWLFLRVSGAARLTAVSNVSAQLRSRTFPRVAGWAPSPRR